MYQYNSDVVKLVSVRLLSARATSFSAQDNQVVLEVRFDDGSEKQIYQTISVDIPEETAEKVLKELIRMEENINTDFDGERFSGQPRILIHDKEIVQDKLSHFFGTLKTRMERVRHSNHAHGYLDLVRAVNRMEVLFE